MSVVSAKWVVLWSLWLARLVRQPTMPVRVAGGDVRGEVAADGSHAAYLGMPYARVVERFQAPQPIPAWDGILDVYEENVRCTQRFDSKGTISGREDCLTMNIYTPLPTAQERVLPVMVFIHGGGFRDGSSSRYIYGPEYLIRHDVILVTFNYRLEILGFLCLGIKEAPGNAGLKDQVEALKWVKKNIRAFGGDPDNITIFGESAGAAAVMYHLISPMSKGLYHKAIMQSGSAISPWAFQFEPVRTASLLAKSLGYDTDDPKEIHRIFMSKSAEELMRTRVPRAEGDMTLAENIFVPCVEKKLPGVDSFIDKTPYRHLIDNDYLKVPILLGYNNEEGYMFIGKENDTTLAKLDFYKALPRDLKFPSDKDRMDTARKVKKLYMGHDEISKETLVKLSRYQGESCISYSVIATAQHLLDSSDKDVYIYKFCYDGWMNLIKLLFGFWKHPGATHADELLYLFKPRANFITSYFETDFTKKMTTMWTNFAKFGNPTPPGSPQRWPPARRAAPRVFVIDKQLSTAPLWADLTMAFWNQTYTKFRRKD